MARPAENVVAFYNKRGAKEKLIKIGAKVVSHCHRQTYRRNKGRLTSLVRLSYLGPEIVRALLAGSQSNALTPSRLLRLSKDLPHDWKEQSLFPRL
jgi:site-specific DNA recombinase